MSTGAAEAAEVAAIINAVRDLRIVNLAAAGATAWVAYDILITIGQEVAYIWRAKWSMLKFLYLISRYYSFFHLIISIAVSTNYELSLSFCKGWLWFVAYSGPVISAAAIDALLILRLHAVYEFNKRLLIFLLCLYIIEFAIVITVATYLLSNTQAFIQSPVLLSGCLATTAPNTNISLIAWIPNLLVNCTFFVLTIYKFAHLVRIVNGSGLWTTLRKGKNISPIMALFVRDGAICFGMVLAALLLNIIFIIVVAGSPLNQMGTAWLVATYSVAGSRLVLNLRGFNKSTQTTTLDSVELRRIRIQRQEEGSRSQGARRYVQNHHDVESDDQHSRAHLVPF
jgi:hypothetical protein